MRKETINYSSPFDAPAAVARRFGLHENRPRITSAGFYDKYRKSEIDDSMDFVEWANANRASWICA